MVSGSSVLNVYFRGLSHGLKTVHRTVFLTAFRAPSPRIPIEKRKDTKKVSFLFSGVGDGTRTHNAWNHNPVLCQLNYTHHIQFAEMARQEGLV